MNKSILAVVLMLCSGASLAGAMSPDVRGVQDRWAEIKYLLPENERVPAFKKLAEEARQMTSAHPDRADAWIWQGIVLATLAGEKGGLGALGLAKDARKSLEQALELDPEAMEGSAYTSLGSLYYQVPGWPLSFGNDDKARELLKKGLEISPEGIDSNYFWGDFLLNEGEFEAAASAFRAALSAPPRPGREVADRGRRDEVLQAMAQTEKKLASKRDH